MKKKKWVAGMLAAGMLLFSSGCGVTPTSEHGGHTEEAKPPSYTDTRKVPEKETAVELDCAVENLERLSFSQEPSRQGTTGYFEQQSASGQPLWQVKKTALPGYAPVLDEDGEPTLWFDGRHKIYQLQNPIAQEDGTKMYNKFILSGYDIVYLSENYVADRLENIWLREEETGRHITVFRDQETLDKWVSAWKRGQKVLAGEARVPAGTVLVNGRIVDGAKFIFSEGTYVVPIKEVAGAISPQAVYNEALGFLSFVEGNGRTIIPFARCDAELAKKMDVSSGSYLFSVPGFEIRCKLPSGNNSMMRCADLAAAYGWDFYSDGNILLIITDDCDYSDLFVLDTQGSDWVDVEVIHQEAVADEEAESVSPAGDDISEPVSGTAEPTSTE